MYVHYGYRLINEEMDFHIIKIWRAFRHSVLFWKIFENQCWLVWKSYSWLDMTKLDTSPCRVWNSWGSHVHDGHKRTNEKIDSHATKIWRAFRRSVLFWKFFREPVSVDARVILLVGHDKTRYIPCRVWNSRVLMYMMVTSVPTKR